MQCSDRPVKVTQQAHHFQPIQQAELEQNTPKEIHVVWERYRSTGEMPNVGTHIAMWAGIYIEIRIGRSSIS